MSSFTFPLSEGQMASNTSRVPETEALTTRPLSAVQLPLRPAQVAQGHSVQAQLLPSATGSCCNKQTYLFGALDWEDCLSAHCSVRH